MSVGTWTPLYRVHYSCLQVSSILLVTLVTVQARMTQVGPRGTTTRVRELHPVFVSFNLVLGIKPGSSTCWASTLSLSHTPSLAPSSAEGPSNPHPGSLKDGFCTSSGSASGSQEAPSADPVSEDTSLEQ